MAVPSAGVFWQAARPGELAYGHTRNQYIYMYGCVCIYIHIYVYAYTIYISTFGPDRRFHGGTGVRRRRKSGFLERLPAARDRAVPPSGWRGVFTLVTRHGLGAPGFVEVPRARRHEVGSGLPGTSWLRVWRHAC